MLTNNALDDTTMSPLRTCHKECTMSPDASRNSTDSSRRYQHQYQDHIKLGHSNKNQLILAFILGPYHHGDEVDTCLPKGAVMMYLVIKYVGIDEISKS